MLQKMLSFFFHELQLATASIFQNECYINQKVIGLYESSIKALGLMFQSPVWDLLF